MRMVLVQLSIVFVSCVISAFATAQDTVQFAVDSGQLFDASGNIDWNYILRDPDVNELLEITEEQKNALFLNMATATREKNALLLQTFGDGTETEEEVQRGIAERDNINREFILQFKKGLKTILLPHQIDSLNSVVVERALAEKKGDKLVVSLLRNNEFNMSKDDLEKLKSKLIKAQKELEENVYKLRLNAWKELVSSLDEKRQKAVQKRFKIVER